MDADQIAIIVILGAVVACLFMVLGAFLFDLWKTNDQ